MLEINLLGNLLNDPLVEKPSEARKRAAKAQTRQITMCGCEKHPVNPKKDVYMQHNHWLAQQHSKVESSRSDLYSVKAIGGSVEKYQPTYDFSGEEFEVTTEQMRIVNDREKKETN